MTSTPYIKIDWSSTSQLSYPQLDNDMEESYDNKDYFQQLLYTHLNADIEEVSYGENDIPSIPNAPLTATQDNIPLLPSDTAPTSENSLKDEEKNTLSVSLKQSHMTTPKQSGYDDKNDFYNLSLITPIHIQVRSVLNTFNNDKIVSPPIVLPTRTPLVIRPTNDPDITGSMKSDEGNGNCC
ncbi:hypothetical protein RhiirC2_778646 [Rhizophagus irregularis]|uniref:Uncharacterized protein n=1 Tax=Rhizophagus irregularis TaxID=588596 RepID=A0A2N1NBM3_9GLOM|nr:hypothetical protein RhiirC2_778646 [Rhizophagus irregularis]